MTVTESRQRTRHAGWGVLGVIVLALAGCGGGSGGGGKTNTAPTATPTPAPTATATPPAEAIVRVTPESATVGVGETLQFQAQVDGATEQAIGWTVQEERGGTISAHGLYEAPLTSGTYHVIAVSSAVPARRAMVTVTVRAGTVIGVVQ